jgi:hypothetical protein
MKLGMRESSTFLPLIRGCLFYLSSNYLHSIEHHRVASIQPRDSSPLFVRRPAAAPAIQSLARIPASVFLFPIRRPEQPTPAPIPQ